MTAVYLAGPYARRDALTHAARALRDNGHTVVSTWHDGPRETRAERDIPEDERKRVASENFTAVYHAETVVMLWPDETRGGLVEAGYAMAEGRRIVCVGDPRTATLMLAHEQWVPDWHAACEVLAAC